MKQSPYNQHFTPDSSGSLHSFSNETANCGMGAIANIHGIPSHDILEKAVESVCNMTHRGGVDADMKTGDGSGILCQIPRKLFTQEAEKLGKKVDNADDIAVGVFFFPNKTTGNESSQKEITALTEKACAERGIEVIGWREVPVATEELGKIAQKTQPNIYHFLMLKPDGWDSQKFERQLYLVRRTVEQGSKGLPSEILYKHIPCMATRSTIPHARAQR